MKGHGSSCYPFTSQSHLGAGKIQIKLENASGLELIRFAYGLRMFSTGLNEREIKDNS